MGSTMFPNGKPSPDPEATSMCTHAPRARRTRSQVHPDARAPALTGHIQDLEEAIEAAPQTAFEHGPDCL